MASLTTEDVAFEKVLLTRRLGKAPRDNATSAR